MVEAEKVKKVNHVIDGRGRCWTGSSWFHKICLDPCWYGGGILVVYSSGLAW